MKNLNISHPAIAGLLISLILIVFAGGCSEGVSEAKYYALKAELYAVKAEIQALKVQNAVNYQVAAYAEINNRFMDAMRMASGEPSKYGYGQADTDKWITDTSAKIAALDDILLTALWESYNTQTPGTTQFKKGTELMGYVSNKILTLTAK
jgi:hypothetical protein